MRSGTLSETKKLTATTRNSAVRHGGGGGSKGMTTGMNATELAGIGAIVLALLSYPLLMRWLAEVAQPTRLRMADLGKELLASPYLDEKQKELVDNWLDDAYDWRFMILFALLMPI